MLFDYSSYFQKLSKVRLIYIEIIAVAVAIAIIIFIIRKFKKNAFTEYLVKEAIAIIVLVGIFVLPQTVALCLDTQKSDIVYEQNVECSVDNNNSLTNGFDYLMFFESVKLENGKSKILCTITGKIPDGAHKIDVVYAKHSRMILDYKVIDNTDNNSV